MAVLQPKEIPDPAGLFMGNKAWLAFLHRIFS